MNTKRSNYKLGKCDFSECVGNNKIKPRLYYHNCGYSCFFSACPSCLNILSGDCIAIEMSIKDIFTLLIYV